MKAKKVHEALQRGGNPLDTMDVGIWNEDNADHRPYFYHVFANNSEKADFYVIVPDTFSGITELGEIISGEVMINWKIYTPEYLGVNWDLTEVQFEEHLPRLHELEEWIGTHFDRLMDSSELQRI